MKSTSLGLVQNRHRNKNIPNADENKSNKTGTSKVGAISKAQKAQNSFFWKKTCNFRKKIEKCCTVPKKIKRGDPLASAGFVGYV